MSNVLKAHVAIKGTRPLIQHRFGPDSIPLTKQERSGVAGNDPEEWRKTCMLTDDGQMFIHRTYIFRCFRDAAAYTKKGRGSIQTLVAATLQVLNDRILIDRYVPGFPNGHKCDVKTLQLTNDETQSAYISIDPVRNPQTKARNIRYRVATPPGWTLEFDILWDKTVVDRNQMQAVCNDAGLFCGLGDGRSIGNGRFQVLSFDVRE